MNLSKSQKIQIVLILNIVVVFIIIVVLFSIFSEPVDYRKEALVLPSPQVFLDEDREYYPPKTLLIPSIDVEADVEHVGVTLSGNMSVPREFENVGWMRHGPEPGSIGNAVMAGHLDTGSGKEAVFYNLKNIKIGDEVFVLNEENEKLRFIVKKIELVDYNNPPKETIDQIFGASDVPMLNLITCDGTWIPEERTYSNRLVIFTEFDGVIN